MLNTLKNLHLCSDTFVKLPHREEGKAKGYLYHVFKKGREEVASLSHIFPYLTSFSACVMPVFCILFKDNIFGIIYTSGMTPFPLKTAEKCHETPIFRDRL